MSFLPPHMNTFVQQRPFMSAMLRKIVSLSSSLTFYGALLPRFLELFLVQFGFLGLLLFFFFALRLVGAQFLGLLGHVAIREHGRQGQL
jgi:hypothetical protein